MSCRSRRAVAILAYIAVWAAAAVLPVHLNDLDQFFWPSAHEVMSGRPLLLYHPFAGSEYPNANGPLAVFPLAAVGLLDRLVGFAETSVAGRALLYAAFGGGCLLMIRQVMLLLDVLGTELSGRRRSVALVLLAACPPMWVALFGYGHIEQPLEILFVVLSARLIIGRRLAMAGVAVGLALLTRTTAVLFMVPLCALVLECEGRRAAIAHCVEYLGAAGTTVAAGLLPFLYADRDTVVHSLVGYRAGLPVWGGSLLDLARGTGAEPFFQRVDGVLVVVAAVCVTAVLGLGHRSNNRIARSLPAVLTAVALCFPLLAKTVWPYYQMEPAVLGTMWLVALRPTRLLMRWGIPVGAFVVANIATNYGTEVATTGTSHRVVSLAFGLTTLALILWLIGIGWRSSVPESDTGHAA